jgi:hypothetical protein
MWGIMTVETNRTSYLKVLIDKNMTKVLLWVKKRHVGKSGIHLDVDVYDQGV